jgi:hypothetical protein
VLVRHVAHVAGVDLPLGTEQTVPVHGPPSRLHGTIGIERGSRNDANERGGVVAVALRQTVRAGVEPVARRAVARQIVRHGERACQAASDALVDIVLDLRDAERGRLTGERLERVVADLQHPLRQAPLARDREVPRQIEIAVVDAGPVQRLEDVLHVRAAILDRGVVGLRAVAVGTERVTGLDRGAGRVLQASEGHDDVVLFAEVHRWAHDQRTLVRVRHRLVQLRPVRDAPAGCRVEQNDRCRGTQ